MRIAHFLFGILFATAISAAEKNRHLTTVKEVVKNYHVHAKHEYLRPHFLKLQRACPGFTEKIIDADRRFEECAQRIQSDDGMLMCKKLESMILNCTDASYSQIVDDCDPKAKGLFSLIMRAAASVVDYLCKQTGETILELSFRSCLWNDLEVSHESLDQCKERIKHRAIWYRRNGFAVADICRDAYDFRDCIDTRVTMTCKCPKTKQAFVGLYDAAIAPCKNIRYVVKN